MKHFKLLLTLFILTIFGIGQVWGETYTITFKTNASDGSTEIGTSTPTSTVISSGTDYVSSFGSCKKAYYSCKSGVKLGTSNATGTLVLNVASTYQTNIKKITIKSAKYGSDSGNLTLYSGSTSLKSDITPGTDYTHTFDSPTKVSSIKITTSSKRAYVSEIILETGSTTLSAPSITTQPSDATYDQGDAATALKVVVSGNPSPTYQWYSNTTNSNENGSEISGATSASYTPSTANTATTYYYCVATNNQGSATSNAAAVTVNAVALYTVTFDACSGSCATESLTQKSKGASISLPTPTIAVEGWKFSGWSETKVNTKTETKPTYLSGTTYIPTQDKTLYAVYECIEGGNGGYLLSEKHNNVTYYMKSDASATTEVSEATEFFWSDGYLYSEKNKVKTYISHTTSGSTSVVIGTDTPTKSWTITDSETTVKFRSTAQTTRYLGYGSGFKAYAATHTLTKTLCGTTLYSSVVAIRTLTGISFGGSLTKTVYTEEETFDPAGITILASYEGEEDKEDITDKVTLTYSTNPLTTSTTSVNVSTSYKSFNINKDYNITVNAIPTYTITASAATGGSYTVKIGDADAANVPVEGTTYQSRASKTITLTTAASEGYKLHSTPFEVKDADDATVSVSKSGDNYTFTMPAKAVTITAQYVQQFSIATTTPEYGAISSITDNDGNNITATSKGSKVWVTVTPDAHYTLSAITVKKADDTEVKVTVDSENANRASFTMPQSNVTVYATFAEKAKHNVTFSINGVAGDPNLVYEGDGIIFPAENPADINGMRFVGWSETIINGSQETAPAFVTEATMGTEGKTYYGVFANVNGSIDVDEITADDLKGSYDAKNSNFVYDDFSDLIKTSSAVYAGNTGATTDGGIVIRAKNNNSGIVTTATGGRITKVEISAWNTTGTTSNRQIDVYGSNTAYTAASNLYDDANAGTLVGNMNYYTTGDGITTSVVFNDEYNYVGIRSNSGALAFDKLIITYGSASFSDYCTTLPSYSAQTLTLVAKSGDDYYATFSNSKVTFIEGAEVSKVSVSDTKMTLTQLEESTITIGSEEKIGCFVPANTGVLIKASSNSVNYYTVENKMVAALEGNALRAATVEKEEPGYKFYKLAYKTYNKETQTGTDLGFYYGAANGAAFPSREGSAYLAVSTASGAPIRFVFNEEDEENAATAVENVEMTNEVVKFIENGQLYILRAGKVYNAQGQLVK